MNNSIDNSQYPFVAAKKKAGDRGDDGIEFIKKESNDTLTDPNTSFGTNVPFRTELNKNERDLEGPLKPKVKSSFYKEQDHGNYSAENSRDEMIKNSFLDETQEVASPTLMLPKHKSSTFKAKRDSELHILNKESKKVKPDKKPPTRGETSKSMKSIRHLLFGELAIVKKVKATATRLKAASTALIIIFNLLFFLYILFVILYYDRKLSVVTYVPKYTKITRFDPTILNKNVTQTVIRYFLVRKDASFVISSSDGTDTSSSSSSSDSLSAADFIDYSIVKAQCPDSLAHELYDSRSSILKIQDVLQNNNFFKLMYAYLILLLLINAGINIVALPLFLKSQQNVPGFLRQSNIPVWGHQQTFRFCSLLFQTSICGIFIPINFVDYSSPCLATHMNYSLKILMDYYYALNVLVLAVSIPLLFLIACEILQEHRRYFLYPIVYSTIIFMAFVVGLTLYLNCASIRTSTEWFIKLMHIGNFVLLVVILAMVVAFYGSRKRFRGLTIND